MVKRFLFSVFALSALGAFDASAQFAVPCEERIDYFSCRPFDNAPCIEGTGQCECNWDNTFRFPDGSGVLTGTEVCPGRNEVEEQSAFCTNQVMGKSRIAPPYFALSASSSRDVFRWLATVFQVRRPNALATGTLSLCSATLTFVPVSMSHKRSATIRLPALRPSVIGRC